MDKYNLQEIHTMDTFMQGSLKECMEPPNQDG